MTNQLISSDQMEIPTTNIKASDKEKLPMRAARGLYESVRSPKNEKAPKRNPHAAFNMKTLGTDKWYIS